MAPSPTRTAAFHNRSPQTAICQCRRHSTVGSTVEDRRGRQIHPGDSVTVNGVTVTVVPG
ncbi:RNA-binding S4 domain-containing protein [Pseudarthrobacter sp. NS4]|uniref:RNA-binding S4 domain-containing protein n=1 Tax=Pseudarthrobacter sp. NS4 TaxID=2973976 RepID=UPI0037CBF948